MKIKSETIDFISFVTVISNKNKGICNKDKGIRFMVIIFKSWLLEKWK